MGLLDSISSGVSAAYDRVSSTVSGAVSQAEKVVSSGGVADQVPPQAPVQQADAFEPAKKFGPAVQAAAKNAISGVKNSQLEAADRLMKAGQYDAARAMLAPLKNPAFDTDKNDPFQNYGGIVDGPNGKRTIFKTQNHADFDETTAAQVDRKLAQCDQLEKMSKVVGHPVDPNDVGQVKEYFDKLSAQKPPVSTGEIQQQFGEYTHNFYVHPGGVDWGSQPPVAQRDDPATLTGMIKDQPVDVTGRRALDCEGFSYLAGAVFKNNPRFDVEYVGSPSHLSACVFEKNSDKGFAVNSLYESQNNVAKIEAGNPQALLRAAHGDWSKVHDKLAPYYHGQNPGGAPAGTATRDLSVADASGAD